MAVMVVRETRVSGTHQLSPLARVSTSHVSTAAASGTPR